MVVLKVRQEHAEKKTKPRDDPSTQITAWIGGPTKMGPVLQIKTTCCLDINGIEILSPSTSGDGSKSWVIMSRDSKRYVEELHHRDPDYFPGRHALAN